MREEETMTTTDATRDRLSPVHLINAEDRPGYAGSPELWRLLASDPGIDAATRARYERNAEQAAAGRV